MDALAGLLDGPRARGALLLRTVLDAPWSMRVQDRAPLTLVALLRGHAWVWRNGEEPVRADAGDILLVRGPDPYFVADVPGRRPDIIVYPNGRCATLDGRPLHDALMLGVRTWGNDPDGAHQMLVGTYQMDGEISRRLLEALPPLVVMPAGAVDTPLVGLLGAEMAVDRPGQQVMLDRLLDLLLITVVRAWFDRAGQAAPAWYRAHADPVVGRALRLIHDDPAHPWTVASLAARTGVSRAALARRFAALVGEPPMTYLTGWRLALAADLLREPDATVEGVARRVGYSTPFALSAAFKRVRGVSPREFRARALAG
ncbi:AraC family transcriptional regulator [Thermomonospora amylolytica]|uniref:AraC family transcriptional regulator n=1 Tax=Thermomonospora amylolytica TaxID=1411117 RepID=UPI000E6BBD09|nr:AraC family transcriptional regulator [Thermomonospora amylolytica]